ncbi:hypothetical protein LG296_20635 (plasmid) [Ureibacillus chungkukjangi]|uniref:hypothetical protein n=1 Tax=Ureibacillus chungkukjangi TaxID=1202712 RepID=UPI000D3C5FDB|nr:hypothetical protein [Ureibacillus chungkukjangi]
MPDSVKLREEFIHVLNKEFPTVRLKPTTLKSGNIRYSCYAPNYKRWMQLDANTDSLSIAMNHLEGDIKTDDIKKLGLSYGLNGASSAIQIQKNDDAVNITIFVTEPYDFTRKDFVEFLHKHFQSYLRLINR